MFTLYTKKAKNTKNERKGEIGNASNKEKRTTNTKQLDFMKQDNLKCLQKKETENENLKDEIDQEISEISKPITSRKNENLQSAGHLEKRSVLGSDITSTT
ncbi:hypothetical protein C1645_98897 [Glomus cerebriforme]|uniref:Uncharacterized protein n=1 Tax=Glomus cerebriforme TaxID=658196 RepID=A0A397T248_9GLOM|nr:hypothetical protein C1645_98897 [Glomus cerebriforme]